MSELLCADKPRDTLGPLQLVAVQLTLSLSR